MTGDFGPRHGQERPWIVPWREAKPGRYSRFAIRAAEERGGVCVTTESRREIALFGTLEWERDGASLVLATRRLPAARGNVLVGMTPSRGVRS